MKRLGFIIGGLVGLVVITVIVAVAVIYGVGTYSMRTYTNSLKNELQNGKYDCFFEKTGYSQEYYELFKKDLEENSQKTEEDNLLIKNILTHSKISCKSSYLKKTVTFYIEAPDMENYFSTSGSTNIQNEDEFEKDMMDYIDHEEKIKKREVTVTIRRHDKRWQMEPTVELYDAMTGGLLSGYSVLYQEFITDLKEK